MGALSFQERQHSLVRRVDFVGSAFDAAAVDQQLVGRGADADAVAQHAPGGGAPLAGEADYVGEGIASKRAVVVLLVITSSPKNKRLHVRRFVFGCGQRWPHGYPQKRWVTTPADPPAASPARSRW